MKLEAHDLVLAHGSHVAVDGASLQVSPGELLAVVGPNGSGKSTLLRGLARVHPWRSGTVTLDGRAMSSMGSREVARSLAILPQSPEAGLDLTVRELAWRGRYPHQGILQRAMPRDYQAVDRALQAADVADIAERVLGSLSGGERQRAWIALALAQEPRVLLLDEPTTSLDLRHQLDVMRLLRRLSAEGMAIIVVLHDLALVGRNADRVLAISEGRIVFDGPPRVVFTREALERVFDVPMMILIDPVSGLPIPLTAAAVDASPTTSSADSTPGRSALSLPSTPTG